jgi:hypothetical protein
VYNYTQALLYSSKVNETTSGNFASENETSGNFQTGTAYIYWFIYHAAYQPRTQDLSLGKTLAAAGHVTLQNLAA